MNHIYWFIYEASTSSQTHTVLSSCQPSDILQPSHPYWAQCMSTLSSALSTLPKFDQAAWVWGDTCTKVHSYHPSDFMFKTQSNGGSAAMALYWSFKSEAQLFFCLTAINPFLQSDSVTLWGHTLTHTTFRCRLSMSCVRTNSCCIHQCLSLMSFALYRWDLDDGSKVRVWNCFFSYSEHSQIGTGFLDIT